MRLKELRKQKGLTQQELGNTMNCTHTAINYYENGRRQPDVTTLCKLADFFGVSVDYILGREDNGKAAVQNSFPNTTTSHELPPDEVRLLEKYRLLQTGYQALIEKQIQFLLDQQEAAQLPPRSDREVNTKNQKIS